MLPKIACAFLQNVKGYSMTFIHIVLKQYRLEMLTIFFRVWKANSLGTSIILTLIMQCDEVFEILVIKIVFDGCDVSHF